MKGKVNYKSKRTLGIVIAIAVLFAAVAAGTAFYIKGNNDTKAAEESKTIANSTVDANTDKTNEKDSNNGKNSDKDDISTTDTESTNNEENNDDSNNANNGNNANTPENNNGANNEDNNGTDNAGANTNNENNGNNGNNEERTTTTTDSQDVPSRVYTQTGETVERKVSDEFLVSWTPIAVNAITEQVNKPDLEIKKKSYINNEKEEDTEIHSAVIEKDYITYKISVKNNSDIDAKNIHIYDSVPEGTKFIEVYDNGTEKNGKLTWIKDVKAREESIVSYRVQVKLPKEDKELENKKITQIDNTAIVDGEKTNTTHNPIITFNKEVKVISTDNEELDNQIVTPGTHLRYYINLTNESEYDGTTMVRDNIPEGTSFIEESISDNGEYDKDQKLITWKNVEVKAGKTVRLSFDVTVNRGTRMTVSNKAKIGPDKPTNPEEPTNPDNPTNPENPENPENPTNPDDPQNPSDPEEPDEPQYTNEVKTPVLLAAKTSKKDGKEVHETNVIKYKIEITNTADPEKEDEKDLVGTAKLIDKFWNGEEGKLGDDAKVEFVRGSIKINGEETDNGESFLSNIEIEVKAGETVTIEYKYKVKEMTAEEAEGKIAYTIPDEGFVTDIIRNNLYWKNPETGDPSRPENENDDTTYENPNREDDPTPPEKDENDNDDSNKDPDHPIDTVKVTAKEEYIKKTAIKTWNDYTNMYNTRPTEVTFALYRNGRPAKNLDGSNISKTLTTNNVVSANDYNNWKVEFTKLKKFDADSNEYEYTIQENNVNPSTNENYKKVANSVQDDALRITNQYFNPEVKIEKHVKVISSSGKELDNQPVVPGTRLRYKIVLKNTSKVDAFRTVEDIVPEGTTLYQENGVDVISTEFFAEKAVEDGKTTLKWEKVKVPAAQATGASTTTVSFDVIVNNSTRKTVKNSATMYKQEDPENSKEETKQVQTPVIIARKTSKMYDGNSYTEKTKITYLVEIVATEVKGENSEPVTATTAKLVDKFWNGDDSKVKYVSGSLKINGVVKKSSLTENEIKNISVDLKAGDKASIEYIYEAKDIPTNVDSQLIKNNLYWAKPGTNDPARPGDDTEYKNPNPDRDNEFKNDELRDYIDPTNPEVDPRDNDTSNKDPQKPIDTVVVEIFSIKANKKVNAVSSNKELLDNQPVVPGSRLRYTIELTNNSNHEGTINVSDVIPAGTTLIKGSITNGGKNYDGVIKWNDLKVPANTTKPISFDVTVNNNTRATVKNSAKTGTDPDPSNQTPTNEVQTPVIIARKKSKASDGKEVNGSNVNEVTYLVEIVATDVNSNNTAEVKEATVKLIDKFWNDDVTKVEYKEGSLKTTGFVNGKATDEETIKNIEAKLSAGEKVTLEYTYKLKQIGSKLIFDTIENNLYWKNPGANDPARPDNNDDNTKYSNPNPDSKNEFKNDELKNYKDPTDPEKDPKDNDNSDKDASNPIDTVQVILIRNEKLKVTKIWNDNNNSRNERPPTIKISLFASNKTDAIKTATISGTTNNWVYTFDDEYFPMAYKNANGNLEEITYTVKEEKINNYKPTYTSTSPTELVITNKWQQDITGTITISNSKSVPLDVVFVLDISSSMLDGSKAPDMVNSVNDAITTLMKQNANNRFAIELYNSGTYKFLELGSYTPKDAGEYLKYDTETHSTGYKRGKISLNINGKTGSQLIYNPNIDGDQYYVGTYTQGGVDQGEKLLVNSGKGTTATVNGKTVTRTPVMILLTDGDPTHYDKDSITDPKAADPKTQAGRVYGNDSHDLAGDSINWNYTGRVPFATAEHYYYTMKTIESSKAAITSKYGKQAKLYTIGIGMQGAMAKALINPTQAAINKLNLKVNSNGVDIYDEIRGEHLKSDGKYELNKKGSPEGKQYYVDQQNKLYRLINGIISYYPDQAFTQNNANLESVFRKIIETSSTDTNDMTENESYTRKITLTNIDPAKPFTIKVTGTDLNDNTININRSFNTFTEAKTQYASTSGTIYITGSGTASSPYVLNFKKVKDGTISIAYTEK